MGHKIDTKPPHPLYVEAVEKFISSLRDSDYATVYGSKAIDGLEEYKLGIALDIQDIVHGVVGYN